MRLVIDTNIWISALIGANTGALFTILANPDIVLIQCSELFTEIETVLKRPEFQKYLPESDINDFLNYFTAFTEQVTLPPFEDNICRDRP